MLKKDHIKRIGLSDKEATIYLCLLENGPSFLSAIVEKTNLKRSTLYNIIRKMIDSDFVYIKVKGKRKQYYIKNPDILLSKAREQKNFLESFVLPQLRNTYNNQSKNNKISFYDTKHGLKETLKEINRINPEKEELLTIEGDIRNALKIGYDFWRKILNEKNKLGISSRTIIPSEEKDEFIIKNHKIKLRTNNNLDNFNIMLYLFKNKSVIIIPEESFCIDIENKKIKKALNCLFEIIWKKSKPIK